jgi:hypothetical protein
MSRFRCVIEEIYRTRASIANPHGIGDITHGTNADVLHLRRPVDARIKVRA